MRGSLLAALFVPALAMAQSLPFVWTDVTGSRDMPWMGSGARARYFSRDVTKPWDVMNPRGPTIEKRWGSSGGSGEDPYATGDRTVAYLERVGALKGWPAYPPVEGRPGNLAFPFRITIVCIEPVVAILRYDLSATIADPIEFHQSAFPPGGRIEAHQQQVSGGNLVNAVMFGSRVSSRGSLLWFSPEGQPPTPLDLSSGRARIVAKGVTLDLEKRGEEVSVSPARR